MIKVLVLVMKKYQVVRYAQIIVSNVLINLVATNVKMDLNYHQVKNVFVKMITNILKMVYVKHALQIVKNVNHKINVRFVIKNMI